MRLGTGDVAAERPENVIDLCNLYGKESDMNRQQRRKNKRLYRISKLTVTPAVSPRIDETFPGDEFKRVVVPMITRVMPHLVKVHLCIGVSHIRTLE